MPYHKVLIGATQPLTFLLNTVRDFSQVPGSFYCTVQKYTGLEIDWGRVGFTPEVTSRAWLSRGQNRRAPFRNSRASPNTLWFLGDGRGDALTRSGDLLPESQCHQEYKHDSVI